MCILSASAVSLLISFCRSQNLKRVWTPWTPHVKRYVAACDKFFHVVFFYFWISELNLGSLMMLVFVNAFLNLCFDLCSLLLLYRSGSPPSWRRLWRRFFFWVTLWTKELQEVRFYIHYILCYNSSFVDLHVLESSVSSFL